MGRENEESRRMKWGSSVQAEMEKERDALRIKVNNLGEQNQQIIQRYRAAKLRLDALNTLLDDGEQEVAGGT